MNEKKLTPLQITLRVAIIVVVLALLLLVCFTMVRFVPKAFSTFSGFRNLFGIKERVEMTLGKDSVAAGEETELSYRKIGDKSEGYYTISYSCSRIDSSTRLEVDIEDTGRIINCATPFRIGEVTNSLLARKIKIRPISKTLPYNQPLTITVQHVTASSTVAASGSATLTILKGESEETDENKDGISIAPDISSLASSTSSVGKPATPTNTGNTATSGTTRTTSGSTSLADLTVSLDPITVDANGRARATFRVTNRGGRASGSWKFHAEIPRAGQTSYDSPYQSSIPAGKTSVMYLTFDNAQAGTFSVAVDYANLIKESNENNNRVSAALR
jgi:hypothetical protein